MNNSTKARVLKVRVLGALAVIFAVAGAVALVNQSEWTVAFWGIAILLHDYRFSVEYGISYLTFISGDVYPSQHKCENEAK